MAASHESQTLKLNEPTISKVELGTIPAVRCDEVRPECKYTNPKELRSFRFFVDVTAPSLGGVFDSTFWKTEIPRACHLDGAIWHAIISLASAHESSLSTVSAGTPTTADNLHTLLHYNLAVQDLLKSYSPEGWLRVLTLCILFTSICCSENKYPEAQIHFKSGYKMICENDTLGHYPHGYLLPRFDPCSKPSNYKIDSSTLPKTNSFDLSRFHVSLAAHEEKNYRDLIDLWEACPYGCPIDVFAYQGACSHSAFREFIKLLNGQRPTNLGGSTDTIELLSGC
ncbi:hypothetical protein N7527_006031 [Penicillium freii]|nr:hypothetical protein N7527_006031 [Penicillium freii]